MQFIGLGTKNVTGKINIFRHKLDKMGRKRKNKEYKEDP